MIYFVGQSVVSVYEIWTGDLVGEERKIPTISTLSFSRKGSYLTTGSIGGVVTVLSLNKYVQANIQGVLDDMRADPLFWSRFHFDNEEEGYFVTPNTLVNLETLQSQTLDKRTFTNTNTTNTRQNTNTSERKDFIPEKYL